MKQDQQLEAVPVPKRRPVLRRLWPTGLSGKLLVLTIIFVMLTEILVFVPSVSNYRLTWLARHFNTGEAASLALERLDPGNIPEGIRTQLLSLTQTETIVIRRDGASRVLASSQMPNQIARHVQLEAPGRQAATRSITDAFDTLLFGGNRTIRVFGPMEQRSGTLELVMNEKPLRDAMLRYAGNVLLISLLISLVTAFLVFVTLRSLLIRPMQRMTTTMLAFARDPENSELVIEPSGRHDEIGIAEVQLRNMQNQLRGTLKQRRTLADLGLAVSKINHDLRNILASASLFSDRLTEVADPTVKRLVPRLVRTIDRAADYTRSVLDYGKAGEAKPKLSVLRLARLCDDVAEGLGIDGDSKITSGNSAVDWRNAVDANFEIQADSEQIFRVLMNLARNAVQAMDSIDDESAVRRLTVEASRAEGRVIIRMHDTGPGLEPAAKEKLFAAFQTKGRKDGTGLGLAIAAELVKAHGGEIRFVEQPGAGACFEISLPAKPDLTR